MGGFSFLIQLTSKIPNITHSLKRKTIYQQPGGDQRDMNIEH
jgi:hypothetical protein